MWRKQLFRHFKPLRNDILQEKTWMWLRKENLKIKTESLHLAAQNNSTTPQGPTITKQELIQRNKTVDVDYVV